MSVTGVGLALLALVVVAVIAYRAGYLLGQAELFHQGQPTEAEWNALRIDVRTSALASSGGLGCLREYRIAFAPIGGRLRSRHVMVQGLDRLTAFLRQAHVPTPEIERAWRALATRRVHSIPRVGLTPAEIEALGL